MRAQTVNFARQGLRNHFFLAALGLAAALNASATSFNAVSDFSLASNPNGSWSYLASSSLLSTAVVGSGSLAGIDYWWSNQSEPNSDVIGKNMKSSTISFESIVLPVGYLWMDPESESNVDASVKVSTAGTYIISGNFLGIDTGEQSHPVQILLNGTPIFSGTIASYGQSDSFNLTETLAAGSVLAFENETGSTWTNLSTGLAASVTPRTTTPEPTSVALAGLGCVLVALRIRKARAKRLNVTAT